MASSFLLPDSHSLSDLRVFLGRSERLDTGSVRLVADRGVLAVYVAILTPAGLLDASPTVLGLRTFALADDGTFDVVVTVRSLLDRLARFEGEDSAAPTVAPAVSIPQESGTAPWAGISPPRTGWEPRGSADPVLLERVAREGIDEVAAAVLPGTGEQIVTRVRSEVWNRPIPGLDGVPAGAAFAALSLGFLAADDPVAVYRTGPWYRLSSGRGHVLVRSRGSLASAPLASGSPSS
ncbi:hypothetical protein [Planctomonas psychrotolerans]|uniref:hypothetical protein n=1 Tax=Planctomonas psychrotolerans TaxID=2528712 RepID=UPI00123C3F13|nr:hypothetical protein [Planctomonas psychrotolerans]